MHINEGHALSVQYLLVVHRLELASILRVTHDVYDVLMFMKSSVGGQLIIPNY